MKTGKILKIGILFISVLALSACNNSKEKEQVKSEYSATVIADIGGVDDKSFNQSAWEGLQEWGKENNKKKGVGGYSYYQSNSDSDYLPNLNTAINDGFQTIFGLGFKIKPAIEEIASSNKDTEFVIIDDIIEGHENVASVIFKDNEAAYLAGVAAAKTTKTNKLGFIGGQEGDVVGRFEAGFVAGVTATNPNIDINIQYAGSFGDSAKGKAIASAMYKNNIDIIFHAAGDTGNGVFSEAKDIMNNKSKEKVWVIGVDRDQNDEGKYNDGNVTLTSTVKDVGIVVNDIATKSENGNFPSGELLIYGLKDSGVSLTEGQLTTDVKKAVQEAENNIKEDKINVPDKPKK